MPYLCRMQPGTQQYGPDGHDDVASQSGRPPSEPTVLAPAKARTGLIVLVAILTEIVLIAAGANEWLSRRLARADLTVGSVESGVRYSVLTYSWRFTPLSNDSERLYAGSWTLVGTTVVASALLIATVVRGPVTWDRAFFGTWMAVPFATMLGGYARAFVLTEPLQNNETRVSRALFGTFAPGTTVFLAGLGLGFIVAILVSVVAVTTKRRPTVAASAGGNSPAAAEPGSTQWQDRYYGPPPQSYGGGAGQEEEGQTAPYASLRKDDPTSTSRLPDLGSQGGYWGGAAGGPGGAAGGPGGAAGGPGGGLALGAGAAMGAAAAAAAGRDRDGESPAEQRDEPAEGQPGDTGGETAVLPRYPQADQEQPDQSQEDPQATQAHEAQPEPARDDAPATQPSSPEAGNHDQPTTQFPRPPDDEDIHADR